MENCRWYAVVCNGSAMEIHGLTTRGNSWGINVDNLAGSPSRFAMDAGTIGEEVSVFFQSGNAGVSAPTTGVISGGTYRQVGFLPETTGVELTITGGTFSFDPSAYTGSAQVQDNGDGTWTVHPSPDQGTGTPGGSDEDTSSPDEEDPDTPDGDSGSSGGAGDGSGDGSGGSGAISRQQLAVVLYRYAGSPSASYAHAFPDGHLVADYAADAMAWAVESGIINGRADGTLDPTGRATRAQVAAMVQRYCFQMG